MKELSLEEIKEYFLQTRDRIRQIEEKALNRLFPGVSELKNETEKLRIEKGSEPTVEEIAQKTGWSLERVLTLRNDEEKFNKEIEISKLTGKDLERMQADIEKMIENLEKNKELIKE